ncbi:MAG: hypothetical protein KAI47_05610, partial [Deltaproteobacteria bacterium]|nr:hypothetical protein [Deltaproteobacteria bacterium]
WLKMEVADDVGLGLALKRSGARCSFYLGEGLLSLTWYSSVRELVLGFEKNLYGVICRYRLWHLFIKVPLLLLLLLGPLVALAIGVCHHEAGRYTLAGHVLPHRRSTRRPAGQAVGAHCAVASRLPVAQAARWTGAVTDLMRSRCPARWA